MSRRPQTYEDLVALLKQGRKAAKAVRGTGEHGGLARYAAAVAAKARGNIHADEKNWARARVKGILQKVEDFIGATDWLDEPLQDSEPVIIPDARVFLRI